MDVGMANATVGDVDENVVRAGFAAIDRKRREFGFGVGDGVGGGC